MNRPAFAVLLTLIVTISSAAASDLFSPWTTPPKFQVLKTEKVEGVELSEILIESVEGTNAGGEKSGKVFALIARPTGKSGKKLPGMLLCHGAGMSVLREKVLGWAKAGYVAISPEFAGYINRDGARSEARFIGTASPEMYTVDPNPRGSLLYDSIQTGLASFELLRAQPDVDSKRIGITGVSWGGVMALKLAGILEGSVAAVSSLYGTGFFLRSNPGLGGEMTHYIPDSTKAEAWVAAFDPSSTLSKIKAPVFLQAATNDQFFSPGAAYSTLKEIQSPTFLCFAPNKSHWMDVAGGTTSWTGPSWTDMEVVFFNRALGGESPIFPQVTGNPASRTFTTNPAPTDGQEFIYYTTDIDGDRSQQVWTKLSATREANGSFSAKDLPLDKDFVWFGGVSFPARSKDGGGFVTLTTPIFNFRGAVAP